MKKKIGAKALTTFVSLMFAVSAVYVAAKMLHIPAGAASDQELAIKGDYTLKLVQCVLGMIIMLLPGILERKLKLEVPPGMLASFALFLFCAIYLGEMRNFYFRIPHWDTMLHAFSGAAICAIGLSIVGLLNKSQTAKLSLSPGFIALFAFCFAVAVGAIWEIYEFTIDALANTNTQKFMLESGEILIGKAALADTMKDLIVDSLGALTSSIVGYVSMKREDGWLERIQLRISRPEPEPAAAEQPEILIA